MKKRNELDEQDKQPGVVELKIRSNKFKRPYGLLAGAGLSGAGLSPREAWETWNEYQKDIRKGDAPKNVQPSTAKKTVTAISSKSKADKPSLIVPESMQPAKQIITPTSTIIIPELSASKISLANSNSMYDRGSVSEWDYKTYANKILSMDISDSKKEKLLGELKKRWDRLLDCQAQHVPWTVSGPANYNAKKLDKSSQIYEAGKEITDWFAGVEESVKNSKSQYKDDDRRRKAKREEEWLNRAIESGWYNTPTSIANGLAAIAPYDPERFVELYEQYDKKYKFRKNTTAAKLYEQTKAGNYKGEKRPEKLHETENLNTYKKTIQAGERVFMKFTTRPKPQLIYALKKRGWHWNSNESAWGIDVKKYDPQFVAGIDENYKKYL